MTDAEILRAAAVILYRRSSKPNGQMLKALVRLLNDVADRADDKATL